MCICTSAPLVSVLCPGWAEKPSGKAFRWPLLTSTFLLKAVRPHLGAIAAKMEEMWNASQLSVSERNVLCDSMLAAAASGGPDLFSQVSRMHVFQQ